MFLSFSFLFLSSGVPHRAARHQEDPRNEVRQQAGLSQAVGHQEHLRRGRAAQTRRPLVHRQLVVHVPGTRSSIRDYSNLPVLVRVAECTIIVEPVIFLLLQGL
jgi:hypothetical protein